MTGAQAVTSGGRTGAQVLPRHNKGLRVNRILAIVVAVGTFAFIAAAVGGMFAPPVYSLASAP